MHEARNALKTMENRGDITYPCTGDQIKARAKDHWSTDKNISTFFEALPSGETFHSEAEVMGMMEQEGDVETPGADELGGDEDQTPAARP